MVGKLMLTLEMLGTMPCMNSLEKLHLNHSLVKDKSQTLLNGSVLNNLVKVPHLGFTTMKFLKQIGLDMEDIWMILTRVSIHSLMLIKIDQSHMAWIPPLKKEEKYSDKNLKLLVNLLPKFYLKK